MLLSFPSVTTAFAITITSTLLLSPLLLSVLLVMLLPLLVVGCGGVFLCC